MDLQWKCKYKVMNTRYITLSAGTSNVRDNYAFFYEIMSTFKAIQSSFGRSYVKHIINRILHSWSFHMNYIKLAEGSFD